MHAIRVEEIPNSIKEYVHGIRSIEFPQQGCTSDVGIIENNGTLYVLKRTKETLYNSWLNKEVFALNRLSTETTLPVPKVKQFVTESDKNQSWALMEFLEGETVRTAICNEKNQDVRREIIFNFGKALRQIHSTPCPKEMLSGGIWLDEMLSEAQYNLKNFTVDGSQELLEKITNNKPHEFKQTLIHGDYTIDNVLVHKGKVTGVIDWSGGTYGDPRYDVSLAIRPEPYVFNSEKDKEIFFEGYGERIIDHAVYDYYVNGLYEFF